ncbi:MAG: prepilin-type N-terminal cleavage/methylation domain-containing protein [Elusimicrobia bacterium]|nr:prepilin-type N-terminal cleavage/methylation domain-containing protein [Elusimicrobiota bacterium]
MKNSKKEKGFTLVEMVIVVALVIILSTISVPLYKGNVEKARQTEGYALLGVIRDAQLKYYAEYRTFIHCYAGSAGTAQNGWPSFTCNDNILGIDARANRYYTDFCISHNAKDIKFAFTAGSRKADNRSVIYMAYNLTSGVSFYESKWN